MFYELSTNKYSTISKLEKAVIDACGDDILVTYANTSFIIS